MHMRARPPPPQAHTYPPTRARTRSTRARKKRIDLTRTHARTHSRRHARTQVRPPACRQAHTHLRPHTHAHAKHHNLYTPCYNIISLSFSLLAGYSLRGNHQCVIYRKMILIIIIISLGKILLSYIANTSRTHARTHAHPHTHTRA